MELKIFTTNESRIRFDFESEPYYWWLRSANSNNSRYAGYVFYNGSVVTRIDESCYNDVLPACTI